MEHESRGREGQLGDVWRKQGGWREKVQQEGGCHHYPTEDVRLSQNKMFQQIEKNFLNLKKENIYKFNNKLHHKIMLGERANWAEQKFLHSSRGILEAYCGNFIHFAQCI